MNLELKEGAFVAAWGMVWGEWVWKVGSAVHWQGLEGSA